MSNIDFVSHCNAEIYINTLGLEALKCRSNFKIMQISNTIKMYNFLVFKFKLGRPKVNKGKTFLRFLVTWNTQRHMNKNDKSIWQTFIGQN